MCGWKSRSVSSGGPFRYAKDSSDGGSAPGSGMGVRSTSTGMTGMLRFSADSTSIRTMSFGLSMRREPSAAGPAQFGPTRATRMSPLPKTLATCSRKSTPSGMLSMSMKTLSAP